MCRGRCRCVGGRCTKALAQVRKKLLHLHLHMLITGRILEHIPVMTSVPVTVMMLMTPRAVSMFMTMFVVMSMLVSTVFLTRFFVGMIAPFTASSTLASPWKTPEKPRLR